LINEDNTRKSIFTFQKVFLRGFQKLNTLFFVR